MAHDLIHPALRQTLRAAAHRIGAWAVPVEDAPTLILDRPMQTPAPHPVHRIHTPACLGDSCHGGRSQCRTPDACYLPAQHQSGRVGTDAVDAVVIVVCTAVLSAWAAAALIGANWSDALRVLASLAGG